MVARNAGWRVAGALGLVLAVTACAAAPGPLSVPAPPATAAGSGDLRMLEPSDLPEGFREAERTDLDVELAVDGNIIDGAEPLFVSSFRAGQEVYWSGGGGDTAYQLVLRFDAPAAAQEYLALSTADGTAQQVDGHPGWVRFHGTNPTSGKRWTSIVLAQGDTVAVTQYASAGEADPDELALSLAARQAALLT